MCSSTSKSNLLMKQLELNPELEGFSISSMNGKHLKELCHIFANGKKSYINEAIKIIKKQYNENYQDNSFNNDLRAQKIDSNNFFSLFKMGDDNDSSNEDELEEYLHKPAVNFKTDPLQW
ncbi:unnamed protein product [Rhizophagus irregularis]|nr:unnamed protein product [Rhizophagus irregularis]